jgi:hypothetical protein
MRSTRCICTARTSTRTGTASCRQPIRSPEVFASAMTYTALSHLMGGWFHQDFDIEGSAVPEILDAFRAVTTPEEQAKLKADIQRFLDEHPNDLDSAFEETFEPDIVASALSGSTRGFLEEIRDLLDQDVR